MRDQVEHYQRVLRLISEEREAIVSGDENLAIAKNNELMVRLVDMERADLFLPCAFWALLWRRIRANRLLRGSGRYGAFPF